MTLYFVDISEIGSNLISQIDAVLDPPETKELKEIFKFVNYKTIPKCILDDKLSRYTHREAKEIVRMVHQILFEPMLEELKLNNIQFTKLINADIRQISGMKLIVRVLVDGEDIKNS